MTAPLRSLANIRTGSQCMERQPVIMIFDVGKTNKKIILFDDRYRAVFEESIQLDEIADEDGFSCEDIHALTNWVKSSFARFMNNPAFAVKAVNFSGYGASLVYVDDNLRPMLPLYDYLKPLPEKIKERFYRQYGGEAEFSRLTASPVLGSLNSGMQLYRLKLEKPEEYNKIKYALHLPQYLSAILTNTPCSEITSIGCHTNLWNFTNRDYHDWVYHEGIKHKLPPIMRSDESINFQYGNQTVAVGIGLHDSSSALIPYLTNFHEPFVLLSTGTWCISLNPFNYSSLTHRELQNNCLCFLTHQGHPVKGSLIFAGHEHDHMAADPIAKRKVDPSIISSNSDIPITDRLIGKKNPHFPETDLNEIDAAEQVYHELIIDIVAKQLTATKLVLRGNNVKRLIIDGEFSKDNIYMNLMAAVFPQYEVFAASMAHAPALGAAIAIHKHWNKKALPTDLIELKYFADGMKQ